MEPVRNGKGGNLGGVSGADLLQMLAEAHEYQARANAVNAALIARALAQLPPDAAARVRDILTPPEGEMPPVEGGKWYSPEGALVVAALTNEYQTAGALAVKLGWRSSPKDKPPDKLYFILNEYVTRGLIDKSDDGYRLPAEGAALPNAGTTA